MASEFKIARLRFNYLGYWAPDVDYNKDAVVTYEGKTYVCLIPHTSGTDIDSFYTALYYQTPAGADQPYWDLVVDGRTWKGIWTQATFYSLGNIVSYGGGLYVCTEAHSSGSVIDLAKFITYGEFASWNPGWDTSTAYAIGDVVKYGGIVYTCNANHVSASTVALGLEADQSKWTLINNGVEFKGEWTGASYRYRKNDLVKFGSDVWIAISGHVSSTTFDVTKWTSWLPGIEYVATWGSAIVYQPGDVVKYGGYSYTSLTTNNTGNIPSVSSANWELLTTGYNAAGQWNGAANYKIGDVVQRHGSVYTANQDNTGQDPSYVLITTSYVELGSAGTIIKVSSALGAITGLTVVGAGFTVGQTIVQVIDNTTIQLNLPPDGTPVDGQAITFTGISSGWDMVIPGIEWYSFWEAATTYVFGDIVVWKNGTYKCIKTHLSVGTIAEADRPDYDSTNTYWIPFSLHARRNALINQGDIITFSNGQSLALPIGDEDQVLVVNNSLPEWRQILVTPKVFYVAPNGLDQADYGITWDRPWKTIRYAAEFVGNGTEYPGIRQALTANKEYLIAEMYQWMLYQKANSLSPFSPASVFGEVKTKRDARYIIDALVYDASRVGNSQTVAAALAYFKDNATGTFINDAVEQQMPFFIAALNYLKNLILNYALSGIAPPVSYQALNNVASPIAFNGGFGSQPTDLVEELLDIVITALVDQSKDNIPLPNQGISSTIMVKTGTYHETLPIVVPAQVAIVGDELRGVVVQPALIINTFAIKSESADNTFTVYSTEGMYDECPIQIVRTSDFITNLTGVVGGASVVSGTTYYVIGDSITPTKFSISAAPGGSAIPLQDVLTGGFNQIIGGDAISDMFRCRNATGLRNLTLSGLLGTLTEQNEFFTSRPTGGAFVALDPGLGVNDTSAWIQKRSPYIQNVTMFGVGCSGMKVDGTLHGGGNKSMTANDFTCIISDGIGAWITGSDSKAELVSVFSYYCYTSYFAEDGGRIRGTNGNSSYGVYGCVAEGFDANEDPITATIDNRTTQATAEVQQAFGQDANVLKLEYNNAGSEYNQATTNLITYSNNYIDPSWVTDGNITIQQNLISPSTYNDGWTFTGLTANTDSSYIYKDITISPTGAIYTNLFGSNISGSGSGASFDITVNATSYAVVVSTSGTGGTGYVLGNQITIYGSQVGGVDGLNDVTLTVSSLVGSTIISVTPTGTVPAGSALNYTASVHVKKGTSNYFDLIAYYTGAVQNGSGILFNFQTLAITPYAITGGVNPTQYGVISLTNGWYRIWFTTYDTNALNNNLRFTIYPRGLAFPAGYSHVYGSQLEIGSAPGFYLTTTSAGRFTAYADYVISGAGTGAVIVADEIRSKSVYETRITDPLESGAGGSGYLTSSNNASGGDPYFILLSGAEVGTAAEYNGMRVFINSGTGAGQFGFIANYDAGTKQAFVCKESVAPLTISVASSDDNTFSLANTLTNETDVTALYVDQPVQFLPTYYNTTVTSTSQRSIEITNITGGTTNTMNTADTSALYYNMAVTFSGTGVTGGVVENFTYYIYEIGDQTTFKLSATPFGNELLLNNVVPTNMFMDIPTSSFQMTTTTTNNMLANMPIQFTGQSLGGVTLGNVYYINDVLNSTTFTISLALITPVVTATTAGTGPGLLSDRLTVSSTSNLVPLNPIVFSGEGLGGLLTDTKYYISNILTATQFSVSQTILNVSVTNTEFGTNLITCNSTSGFIIDNPIKFSGNSFGGINNETTYYILAINDGATFAVSTSKGASSITLTTATGSMVGRTCPTPTVVSSESGTMAATTTSSKLALTTTYGTMTAVFSTPIFGGVDRGTTYYVRTITPGNPSKFTITSAPGGLLDVALTHGTGTMQMGEVGWDHVNPGTPSEANLDSTSLYFIEPRLTFSPPNFQQNSTTLPTSSVGTTYASIAYGANYWIAVPNGGNQVARTDDGITWEFFTLPTVPTDWSGVAYGNTVWVIISSGNDKVLYSFSNGQSWKSTTLPSSDTWSSIAYGAGNFVALATGTTKAAYSTTFGATWSAATLPGAIGAWTNIAYGNNRFVTVANASTRAAYSTNGGQTWTASTLPGASSDWTAVAYGNERFVAVAGTSRKPVYSFDGITWYTSNYSFAADHVCYGNGVFLALETGGTTAYVSEDGTFWKQRTVSDDDYEACAFGFTATDNEGVFIITAGNTVGSIIEAGAKTKGRPNVESGVITSVTLFETGSNYDGVPTVTVFDPSATSVATLLPRVGNGVLSAPTFINRGLGYNTSSTEISINGSGYADQYQVGLGIAVSNLTSLPRPGDDLTIDGDDIIYKVTSATAINGTVAPNITAIIEISPPMSVALSPDHDVDVVIREKYSQVRLTNHDFLNVGYGSQPESGYPGVPAATELQAQNQTIENNFGRVFFTSTDQDGNFKVGNLFGVEQATGIVTLSASQFGLTGLEQLSLGGIAVGGSSVVVTQFSTDSTFVANSDTIIPTQKAIKSYLSARLSQGGSNTFTGQTTAGTVVIGGPNQINNTIPAGQAGSRVEMVNKVNFFGTDGGLIDGGLMALDFFMTNATKRGGSR